MNSKQARSSFLAESSYRASRPLELIHGDICGPIEPHSLRGSRFFLLLIDDFSRMMWVSMLKRKSDALDSFKKFKALAETEKNSQIGCLRTDQGGEFTSNSFSDFCEENGIRRQFSSPYSPQQNGVVERRNQTIMNMVKSMLKTKNFSKNFWGEAVNTTTYLLNCSPTKSLDGKLLMKLRWVKSLEVTT